jgi:hypothetical protein
MTVSHFCKFAEISRQLRPAVPISSSEISVTGGDTHAPAKEWRMHLPRHSGDPRVLAARLSLDEIKLF